MKTKRLFLMAAMMLMSVCAFAQSNSNPLKGDVNGDGKVDVADIVAILKIMKDGGGTSEGTKYYWYVGPTDPSTMTSISPIVTDTSSPGWRLIGDSLPNSGTVLFDGTGSISMNSSTKVTQYIAINSTDVNLGFYDSLGNEATTFVTGPTVVNGWNVYTTNSKSKSFDAVLKVK